MFNNFSKKDAKNEQHVTKSFNESGYIKENGPWRRRRRTRKPKNAQNDTNERDDEQTTETKNAKEPIKQIKDHPEKDTEKPTKKQLYYYDALCKKYGLEKEK